MTQTTTTTARSEAYEYGRTGQPFCPPPPAGLAYYEEAAWVADFHQGREDREAASAAITSGPVNPDTQAYLEGKRAERKAAEQARRERAAEAAEQAKQNARDEARAKALWCGYRDGYYNAGPERRRPAGEDADYDEGLEWGREGNLGRPELIEPADLEKRHQTWREYEEEKFLNISAE